MASLLLVCSEVYAQEWKELTINGNFEGSNFSCFFLKIANEDIRNLKSSDIVVDNNDANNHCAQISFTKRTSTQLTIKLTEPLVEGDLFEFSIRAKSEVGSPARLNSEVFDRISISNEWKIYTVKGVINTQLSEAQTITFNLDNRKSDIFYFDDISFKVRDGSAPIEFADAKVKEICVNNWDKNKDGELSLGEAAVVNDLNQVFFCNYDITSFNEFQYFIGLTTIDGRDFYGCSNLTSIIIPNNVTEISPYTGWPSAFQWCGRLASVTLGNKVETIGADSFTGCESLTSIVIPNSVTYIGEGAFSGCSNLTKIYCYPEKIPEIGANAFGNHTNSILHVPANLVEDYSNAELWKDFGSIAALDSSIDGFYYCFNSNDKTAKVASASDDYSGALTIPSAVSYNGENYNVTSIGTSAFYGCSGITSITIPSYISNIGEKAFTGCYGISSIVVDEGNSKYESRDNCNAIIEKMSNTLLMGCKKTVIPDGIKTIGDFAFYNCSGLSSVIIPNSVESIGNNAFEGCKDMTSITLGNGLTTIGEEAFIGCSGLTSLSIPGSVKTIGKYAFMACRGLNAVYITNLEAWCGFNFIAEYANYDNPLAYALHFYINGEEVKDLVIPETVTSIGNFVFHCCPGLTSVTIPNNVEHIGKGAFSNCRDLASITIGNGVKSIGRSAFYNCSALTAVHINDLNAWCKIQFEEYNSANPLNVAQHLYMNGKEVKNLIIPNSVTTIARGAFYGCSGLTSVTIPNNVTSIGQSAFSDCSGLTSLKIGNGITKIDYAFQNCTSLSDVYCYAEQVPETSRATFFDSENTNSIIQNATLHVPAASIEAYSNADPWKDFKEIVALTDSDPNPTGITNVSNNMVTGERYYSLDGKRLDQPQRGLNIIRMSDGVTRKVIVK